MPEITTNALVLRRSEYRDYDRMVTLFSPSLGRIDAVARGCRRPKSPLMNASEVFCAGEYTLHLAKDRYSITSCQIHESFYPIRESYERLIHGAYYLHLILQSALPEQPGEALFSLILRALAHLSYGEADPGIVTLAFELHYMALNGRAPRMDSCARCGRTIEGDAGMDIARGGAVCERCAPDGAFLSHGARRILLRVPQTKFDALTKLIGHESLEEAAQWMRKFMIYHIETPPRTWPPVYGDKE